MMGREAKLIIVVENKLLMQQVHWLTTTRQKSICWS